MAPSAVPVIGWSLGFASVLAVYVLTTRQAPRPLLGRLGVLAAAAWLAEETAIQAYGAYAYDPSWFLFLGHVPVLVPLIWAVLIDSAVRIAGIVAPRGRVWFAAGVVLADAILIETIGVETGLWTWHADFMPATWMPLMGWSRFGAPAIGYAGWAFFGGLASWALLRNEDSVRGLVIPLLLAVGTTHILLVASWWLGLRTLPAIPAEPLAIAAPLLWGLALVPLGLAIHVGPARSNAHLVWLILQRVPGALLLYGMLMARIQSLAAGAIAVTFTLPWGLLLLNAWERNPQTPPPARADPE